MYLQSNQTDPNPRSPAPAETARKQVEGYEMQEVNEGGASSAPIPYLFLGGFLACVGLIALGWRRSAGKSMKRPHILPL